MAKALPADGKLISLELSQHHADVARSNIKNAGFENVVEIRVGKAMESLEKMGKEGGYVFDFVFVDADKGNNEGYLRWALEFSRVGTVIVIDNVVRGGKTIE